MKFSYQILESQKTIVARYNGVFTLAALARSAELIWSDPRYSRDFDGLVDLSDQRAGVALGDFRAFLQFLLGRSSVSEGRWAIIAATPFATACSYMYRTAVAHRQHVEVFSTWDAAAAYLGRPLATSLALPVGFSAEP